MANVATALAVLITLLAFVPIKKLKIESRLIGVASAISVATYVVLMFGNFRGKEVNLPQNIATILIFFPLAIAYYRVLNKQYKGFFIASTFLFLTFGIYNLVNWQQDDYNSYTDAVASFFLIIYCILYLYRLLVELPVQQLHTVPMFWFNSAILLYQAGALFLFLFRPYLIEVLGNDMLIYWSFHNILNVVHQIILIIGLCLDLRNIKLRSLSPSVP